LIETSFYFIKEKIKYLNRNIKVIYIFKNHC
jgi:hypothetical protein